MEIDSNVEELFYKIQREYAREDVSGGEFIIGEVFCGCRYKEEVRDAVQMFLDWDGSPQKFDLERTKYSDWVVIEKD